MPAAAAAASDLVGARPVRPLGARRSRRPRPSLASTLHRDARRCRRRPRAASRRSRAGPRCRADARRAPSSSTDGVDAQATVPSVARGRRAAASRRVASSTPTSTGSRGGRASQAAPRSCSITPSSCCAAASANGATADAGASGARGARPDDLQVHRRRRSARPSARAPRGRSSALQRRRARARRASRRADARSPSSRSGPRRPARPRRPTRLASASARCCTGGVHELRDDLGACRRSRAGRTGSANFSSYAVGERRLHVGRADPRSCCLNGPSAFFRVL